MHFLPSISKKKTIVLPLPDSATRIPFICRLRIHDGYPCGTKSKPAQDWWKKDLPEILRGFGNVGMLMPVPTICSTNTFGLAKFLVKNQEFRHYSKALSIKLKARSRHPRARKQLPDTGNPQLRPPAKEA
ncbi:MAG: hypothetical protein IPO07_25405 [Haliscomenobacter sp.]|nr:hypothetical protein [Haliscomenobacter sp.]MBK9491759.1 hypothetical protein [Haliscomenobacter sp.]